MLITPRRPIISRGAFRPRRGGDYTLLRHGTVSKTVFWDKLLGQSLTGGEIEEESNATTSTQSGGRFNDSTESLLAGGSLTGTMFVYEESLTFAGTSNTGGTWDYVSVSALVDYGCYLLGLKTNRTYQFDSYKVLGVCRFNGKLIGARGAKIYDLETAALDDDGTKINAYFEMSTDFGVLNKTALRNMLVSDDPVTVTLTNADDRPLAVDIPASEFKSLPKDTVSAAWTIKVSNKNGQQITFRRLHAAVDILDLKGEK